MWYKYAKEAMRRLLESKEELEKPPFTNGEAKHDNVRPTAPADNRLNKDGMNHPENVRSGADGSKEAD